MKLGMMLSALSGLMLLAGATAVPTPASAKSKAECRVHLNGYQRTSNPQAQAAMRRAYQACLKQK